MLAHVVEFDRALVEGEVGHLLQVLVGDGQIEAVAKRLERSRSHLLLLVGDVLRLAGLAHPVALDGLGENHRGLALVFYRRGIRRVDLVRIVAAAIQPPDVVVGHVGHHLQQFRVLAEKMLAHVRAVLGLERLVLAVDALFHAFDQQAALVPGEQRIPVGTPDHLDHVPAGTAEVRLQLLDDLAVASHRPIQTLQVAVHHEDQVVELFSRRHADRAHRLGFVDLAIAEEAPDLSAFGVGQAAVLQVPHEARMVDRHDRSQPHRNRRKLPEVRHQPGVRIGRQALAFNLLPEVVHLFLGQAPQHEGSGIDPGGRVPLYQHQVAAVVLRRCVPEMIETDVVERRGRGKTGDMAAQFRRLLVGAQHHRRSVPAHVRTDAVFQRVVPRRALLRAGRDGVDVRGIGAVRPVHAGSARLFEQFLEDVVRTFRALVLE